MYAQIIMNKLIKLATEQELREMYPSTHFPSPILPSHLEGFDDWYVVEDAQSMPEYDIKNQKLEFVRELDEELGVVVGKYNVLELTPEEKKYVAEAKWADVRYHRNNAISSTDYLILADVFNEFSDLDKEKIIEYRAALRNVTNQEDPFNITWPNLGIDSITLKYNPGE
jgi:hypothetical protein